MRRRPAQVRETEVRPPSRSQAKAACDQYRRRSLRQAAASRPGAERGRVIVSAAWLGAAMLEPLGDRISACLEQAERCRQAAASEPDERVRQQLLYLEQQWQVAESFQLIERLQLDHALPPEVEKLPQDFPPE
jgi:hypothetical protein